MDFYWNKQCICQLIEHHGIYTQTPLCLFVQIKWCNWQIAVYDTEQIYIILI